MIENTLPKDQGSELVFANYLREKIARVERRDWELWALVLVVLSVLAAGFFFVIWPAVFMGQDTIYLRLSISSGLAIGLLFLVFLFAVYLVNKQINLRKQRFYSIMEAWRFGVAQTQMFVDPLTKVYNRSVLAELLGKEAKLAQRRDTPLSLLYIDVDDFKEVNTRYGHLSGDLVLTEVGALLKQCARGSDYIVRVGGDEFVVVLMDTDEKGAEVVRSRINQKISKWNQDSNMKDYLLSLSIGIQQVDPTQPLSDALIKADAKMYVEKEGQLIN